MKYALIEEEKQYPVARWAEILQVSKSGYYEWKRQKETIRAREESYKERIQKAFISGEGTYGADRICGIIRKDGGKASFKRVKAHMEEIKLSSIHNRRRQRSLTDSRKSRGEGYPNLTKGLEIERPMQVVTSDISYIRTGEGFLYICKVRDVLSGIVLGCSYSERMTKEIVMNAFMQADARNHIPAGSIFHSDRGSHV